MNLKTITVTNAEGTVYNLRLTLGGQKALKKQHGADVLDLLMNAIADGEIMADVLQQALHYAGSDLDFKVTGEMVYEELIDSGFHGPLPWAKLVLDLAECAGLIDCKQADKMMHKIEASISNVMDSLEDEDTPPHRPEASTNR